MILEEKRKISAIVPYKIENNTVFVFLQKRSNDAKRYPGLFGFFGGGAEGTENPEEALLRETKEELDYIPDNLNHFGKYELPVTVVDIFTTRVDNNFEKKIKILEGDYGRWFNEKDFEDSRSLITGDLKILEDLYKKLK
ncbi:MAG: NUDIX hydrolase [Candidatus Pacebacteria bacterium]|nr:NUDIX hydrolase [Candidatus Paceibacterota bacterium]MDD3970069.1 NUDIX hydrolase [Candidatus Paceibacterota bacterium]